MSVECRVSSVECRVNCTRLFCFVKHFVQLFCIFNHYFFFPFILKLYNGFEFLAIGKITIFVKRKEMVSPLAKALKLRQDND